MFHFSHEVLRQPIHRKSLILQKVSRHEKRRELSPGLVPEATHKWLSSLLPAVGGPASIGTNWRPPALRPFCGLMRRVLCKRKRKSNIIVTNRWLPLDGRRTNGFCAKGVIRDVADTFAARSAHDRNEQRHARTFLKGNHQ
jgi:hypothetical protein